MARDGVPLPPSLSGVINERIVRIDNALVYLVAGALTDLVDRWQFEQTATLTGDAARAALSDMLYCYLWECDMYPVGTINMWPTDTPPDKWLLCNGDEVSRSTYAPLFAIVGDAFGEGDGSTTFNLPDFTDRSPMGANGSYVPQAGTTYGEGTHALTTSENGTHSHFVTDPGHAHRVQKQSATVNAAVNTATPAARTDNTATPHIMTDTAVTGITLGDSGGGQPHNNVHPVVGVYFIIFAGV